MTHALVLAGGGGGRGGICIRSSAGGGTYGSCASNLAGTLVVVAPGLYYDAWLPMDADEPVAVILFWALPTAVVTVLAFAAATYGSKASLRHETRCRRCGYILRSLTEPRCPECGEKF